MTANWFKEFESRPTRSKDDIPWPLTLEYEIQSKYFISNLKSLPDLDKATDSELLSTAEHCNNLIDYLEQMRIMGYTGFAGVIEDLLEGEFRNRHLLVELQRSYTEKWLSGKAGRYKIGENNFVIHNEKFYYSDIRHEWYEVGSSSIFKIMPRLSQKCDKETSTLLNAHHSPTRYQQIFKSWQDANYSTGSLHDLISSRIGRTTPEDVLRETVNKVNAILENPPSPEELESTYGVKDLEYLIKISCLVVDYAQQRRESNEHSLYLLRDCAMFHEAQIILDLIDGKYTPHDQVYLGRQAFSSKLRDSGHWYVAQELLLMSLQKNPKDFERFNADFVKSIKDYEDYSPEFSELVQNLTHYLNNHIEEAVRSNKVINVIDLGFQGSINMLVKYVLDRYCLKDAKLAAKINIYVVAEWFKDVYKDMYASNTFSALTNIEVMARNNSIYNYVPWSLRDGGLLVTYGSKEDQARADIELVVMTMTSLIAKQMGLIENHIKG